MHPNPALEQKLAAILHADVVGYSRLSGSDELGTHHTLRAYLDAMADLIAGHCGRVVNYAGDAVLAEFDKVSNALVCAVRIQQELTGRNRELPAERQVVFRIGINLGEVIVDRDDIYGDGVNVAARLEALAEPAGVAVSEAVYDAIGTKLPLDYEYLGEKQVKNIARPVRVYRVSVRDGAELPQPRPVTRGPGPRRRLAYLVTSLLGVAIAATAVLAWLTTSDLWQAPEPREAIAPQVAAKPSIAVMPFSNVSGDAQQDYFSDGITEDIITDLSRVSSLAVTARNSSFAYKGRTVKAQQIGDELNVRYVVEGSVRRSEDRVRISAQLVRVDSGFQLWAERYDRKLSDVFDLQDEITKQIVAALLVKLSSEEQDILARKTTRNFEAYDLFLRAQDLYQRTTREDNVAAQSLYREAIGLDPAFGRAYGAYAVSLARAYSFGWTDTPNEALDRALELARDAVRLSPALPQTNWALGYVYMHRKQYDQALVALEETVRLVPNYADGYGLLALIHNRLGHGQQAIELIEKATALNPFYTYDYPYNLGRANYTLGRYEDAVRYLREALERNESVPPPRMFLAASYVRLGRLEEAEWEIEQLQVANPGITVRQLTEVREIADEALMQRFLDDLREAGLPE